MRAFAILCIVTGLARAQLPVASQSPPPRSAAPPVFRLVSDATHERLVRLLPRTDDPAVNALLADPRLVVYREAEMPPVFQAANNGTLGVFRAGTSFTVGGVEVGVGSNRMPWRTPAGLDTATGWSSFQFILLPEGGQIAVTRGRLAADVQGARFFLWYYPVGTVLGEALFLTGDPSTPVFELRLRRKLEDGSWRPRVFRPFATRAELDNAVVMSGSAHAERFVRTSEQQEFKFTLDSLPMTNFRERAVKDFLPPLDAATVRHLLSGEFTAPQGREWVPGGLAPDTRSDFHIVPRGYNGAMLPTAEATCASCHKTAGQNVRHFGFASPAGWDEWVRGNAGDQSFRFHPFDPASVSSSRAFLPVRLNPKMVAAGIIKER